MTSDAAQQSSEDRERQIHGACKVRKRPESGVLAFLELKPFSRSCARWHLVAASLPLGQQLRREIHEGLNVVERWNGTNDFIFFGKGGEVATNRLDDQEISILSLHLLQICLVYINTLMIQNVLSDTTWMGRMADEDFRALTPLIHNHVTPYGSFELDLEKRLPLEEPGLLVA